MKLKKTNTKHPKIFGHHESVPHSQNLTAMFKRWRQKLGYFSLFAALPVFFAQEAQAEETDKPQILPVGRNLRFIEKLNRNRNNYRLPFEKDKNNILSNLSGGDNCPGSPIPAGIYTAANPFTDVGDTTGANNTVNSVYCYYCNGASNGPDQIYSFTLTGLGANPRIEVSATSSTYSPMIYVLNSAWSPGCPVGTNNSVSNNFNDPIQATAGGTVTLNLQYFPLNTPLHLFIDSESNETNSSGSYTVRMRDVSLALAPSPKTPFDFDSDGKADISVYRPSDQTWYLNRSSQGYFSTQFGLPGDKIAPAHFDGDGITDITVYRNGTWYRHNSHNNTVTVLQFGLPTDIPVSGHYFSDDERGDFAVYRGGVWWFYSSRWQYATSRQFGLATDIPVPADYNGDGYTDLAVYRNGTWWIRQYFWDDSPIRTIQFGLPDDKPVPADYDGDGRADPAVYRNGEWHILGSNQGYFVIQWGIASDIPVPADYDGDGKTDVAIFRDGVWYLRQSTGGISIQQFGLPGDKPVPAAFLP